MNAFLAELRRRSVLRVAAVYLVTAWVVMQVVAVAMGALDLPGWFDGAAFTLLAVGFPIALVLAWTVELTPGGLKRAEPATAGAPTRPFSITDAGLALMLAGVLGVSLFQAMRSVAPEPAAPAVSVAASAPPAPAVDDPRPSIAVLPFRDFSPLSDQEYFADGLSEELLNQLAQLDGLRVIARTSAKPATTPPMRTSRASCFSRTGRRSSTTRT